MIVDTDGGWASMLLPFLILVGIGIVGVVAWLIWMLTRSNRKKPEVGIQTPPPVAQAGEDVPFLVVRRSGFGDWELYVDGQRVRRMAALIDPAEREEFVEALRFLFTFAKSGTSSTEPGPAVSARPQPSPSVNQPVAVEEGSSPRTPAVERRERYSRASSQDGAVSGVNLAQEISDILDEMVAETPEMRGHSIGLINVPTEGIGFAVDGKVYHDLSEIPNPEIRAMIRKATREWERR